MARPILIASEAQELRAVAKAAVDAYRAGQSAISLDALDKAITEALWQTNEEGAAVGSSHERQILFALGWFAAVLPSLNEADAQSVNRRLQQIEQLAGQLSDLAGRQAEGRS